MGARTPIPRESTKDTVKAVARGRPGLSGWTCGDCRLLSLLQAGHGASAEARPSPRPLIVQEGKIAASPGHHMPRDERRLSPTPDDEAEDVDHLPRCRPGQARNARADPGPIAPGRRARHHSPSQDRQGVGPGSASAAAFALPGLPGTTSSMGAAAGGGNDKARDGPPAPIRSCAIIPHRRGASPVERRSLKGMSGRAAARGRRDRKKSGSGPNINRSQRLVTVI